MPYLNSHIFVLYLLLATSTAQTDSTTDETLYKTDSTTDETPYELDPDAISSLEYELPTDNYSNITWCFGEQDNLPPASMKAVDRLIQKWQGRRITRTFVAMLKRSLMNPNSKLRSILGRVGQDPRDPGFVEGEAAGNYDVPGTLVRFLIHVLGETRTVVGYLWKFGFLPKVLNRANDGNYEGNIPPCAVTNAVREFQRFNGLEPTGVLTKQTRLLMANDRCGNPDVECKSCENQDREKRYAVKSKIWNTENKKLVLTYHFSNYGGSLSAEESRSQVEEGMKVWTHNAPIIFTEVSDSASADLKISWGSKEHGDDHMFDGVGGTLAHAFYPTTGFVHFDDDETFIIPSDHPAPGAASLLYTTAHELGHSLGLKHSSDTNALMYAIFTTSLNRVTDVSLGQDDITGLTALYGPGRGGVYPTGSLPPRNEVSTNCMSRFTATFTDPTSDTLELFMIFGDKYFVLGTKSETTDKTGAKLPFARERTHHDLNVRFSILDGAGPFTAGVTDSHSESTYLFKEGQVCEFNWQSSTKTLDCSDIDEHTRFAGLPASIDGIVNAPKSTLIAFSGDKYYIIKKSGVVNTGGHPLPFSDVYLAFDSFYPGYIYISLRSEPDNYLLLNSRDLSKGKKGCSSTTCSFEAIYIGWSYRSMFEDWDMDRDDFYFCDE